MDDATGQLGGNGTEISDLVPRKNGVRFAISKMSELPPRGGNSDIDTVYFTLPCETIPVLHTVPDRLAHFVSRRHQISISSLVKGNPVRTVYLSTTDERPIIALSA